MAVLQKVGARIAAVPHAHVSDTNSPHNEHVLPVVDRFVEGVNSTSEPRGHGEPVYRNNNPLHRLLCDCVSTDTTNTVAAAPRRKKTRVRLLSPESTASGQPRDNVFFAPVRDKDKTRPRHGQERHGCRRPARSELMDII